MIGRNVTAFLLILVCVALLITYGELQVATVNRLFSNSVEVETTVIEALPPEPCDLLVKTDIISKHREILPYKDISDELSSCEVKPSRFEDIILGSLDKQCVSQVNFTEFVCAANCTKFEPELDVKATFYNMRKYNFEELWKLCDKMSISALVWIKDNVPKYMACGDRVVGRALWNPKTILVSLITCAIDLPDVLYGFDNADYAIPKGKKAWLQPLPGLVRYAGLPSHPSYLFPVAEFIRATTHCDTLQRKTPKFCKQVDSSPICSSHFDTRKDVVFWRGSLTGNTLLESYLDFNPRYKLVQQFSEKKYFDVGFSRFATRPHVGDSADALLDARSKPSVNGNGYCTYKYVMHVEGNSFAGSIGHKLSTGSVVLFVDSPFGFHEFYYKRLEPWVHYVPIDADLGNLESIVAYLIETKEGRRVSRQISMNALKLFDSDGVLSAKANYCYITRLFHTLASQQEKEPTESNLRAAGIPIERFLTMSHFAKLTKSKPSL